MTAGHPLNQPCAARGRAFASQRAAAQALRVCESAISQALRVRGTLDHVGQPRRGAGLGNCNAVAVPVQIGPLWFRSQLAAARVLGVSRKMVRRWIASGQPLEDWPVLYAAALRHVDGQGVR